MRRFNFGGGVPDTGSFPTKEMAEAAVRAINMLGGELAKYPGRGYEGLREIAAERFEWQTGVEISSRFIELTSGAGQAIRILAEYFIEPGDTIVTGEYSYSGILRASRYYKARIIGIPMDDYGIKMDCLEQSLAELAEQGITPKFIYIVSNFQNPTGIVLPLQRRKRMLSLAKEYGMNIIEDDCYGDLRFEGEAVPAIRALDDSETVVYIGSFSKILAAGVRLGYFITQDPLRRQIANIRMDGGTNLLASCIVAEYLKGNLKSHVAEVIEVLRRKRDTFFGSLEQHLGDLVSWTRPPGGPFVWLKLPDNTNTQVLDELAKEKGVVCRLGKAFHYNNEDVKYVRLAFSYPSLDEIREGIPVLAQAIQEAAEYGRSE
ncbi:PLP-dependent aminotransferase family protein [Candidatus Poribacteria bacterium]